MKNKPAKNTTSKSAAVCALALVLLGSGGATVAASGAAPETKHSPTIAVRPANGPVVQMPIEIPQFTTLKSIKQAQNTLNTVGETWFEVQGTGHCSFTIWSAGSSTQTFASSATTPFPIKVAFIGALPGAHQWYATGVGNCKGKADVTF